uniref:Indole-3-acetic acid-induced protein ARG2 n=1 Tax=Glycine max TaxID=3847 RepID=C6SZC8_SOYBN|nr:unknown [Glycine max]
MTPSFTSVKIFSSLVLDGFFNALTRRGYAVASQSATKEGVGFMSGKMAPKSGEDNKGVSTHKVSWVPDPVTGYYKPENINEIDPAELRAMLLGKKIDN